MKIKNFKIEIYDYKIKLIQLEKEDNKEEVYNLINKLDISKEDYEELKKGVEMEGINGGYTLRNNYLRNIICFFYPFTSKKQKYNVYNHEKRHVEDRICEWLRIEDIEASAYLAGFLGERFWEFCEQTNK